MLYVNKSLRYCRSGDRSRKSSCIRYFSLCVHNYETKYSLELLPALLPTMVAYHPLLKLPEKGFPKLILSPKYFSYLLLC